MSNPFSGLITTAFKDTHQNMIEALIEQNACSVQCRLIFTGLKFDTCPDCIDFNPIGNRLGNPYHSGGTGPFLNTSGCPTCNGSQKIPVETTENIDLLVIWQYRRFISPFGQSGVSIEQGDAQTFAKKELGPKLKNCQYIIFDTDIEEYKDQRFVRNSENIPCGLGRSPFIYTTWKKT